MKKQKPTPASRRRVRKEQEAKPEVLPKALQNEMAFEAGLLSKQTNGLGEATMGFDANAPWAVTTQLSQANTLFKSNRWYLISNLRQLLSEIYVEHGIVKTVVDVPVDDAMRGGITIQSQQLSPEQIQELEIEVERQDDLGVVGQGGKWNRLFGGAGIVILTEQDPATPLDIEAIGPDDRLEFRASDMWELFYNLQNMEGFDAGISNSEEFEFFSYYGVKVHKSRVMLLKGITAPSFIRPRLRGWGLSIVETLVRSINQYLKSTDLMFEVLDEFKIDVYKFENLVDTLFSPDGDSKVRRRVQTANLNKNYLHAVVLDAKDEFDHKELSFAGLAEVMRSIREQIACDMRMPIAKIFGISATGFSSGEDDIENYNSMVESQVRAKIKFYILQILELRCQKLFGFVPDDMMIEFKPLRILTSEQEENVKNAQFTRLLSTVSAGLMTPEEFKNAINKENLLGIQLDTSIDQLDMGTDEDSEGEPGADKPDSAKIAPSESTPKKPKEAKS